MAVLEQRACRTKGCEEPVAEGATFFCVEHVAPLLRVKASEAGRAAQVRAQIGKKGQRSTCCNPACKAPRLRSERYCDACQDEGWNEEDLT